MKKQKFSIKASDIVILAIGILFLIGSLTFFKACDAREDGGWMTCHWANQAVTGIAAVLAAEGLIHLLLSDSKIKIGLDAALIPTAVLAALIPDRLISLCMMDTMRCHAVFAPGVLVSAILVIAAAVWDILARRSK